MPSPGYANFTGLPVLTTNSVLDGVALDGQVIPISESWERPTRVLRMADGSHVVQRRLGDVDRATRSPLFFQFEMTIDHESDYRRLMEIAHSGRVVLFFASVPVIDTWYIKHAPGSQATWKTTARVGWGLPGVSHSKHPPEVQIDGVAQTIITSGTPTAGEAKVPETQSGAQNWETIETPAGLAGTRLTLLYWPEMLVTFASPVQSIPVRNRLEFVATLEEFFSWA